MKDRYIIQWRSQVNGRAGRGSKEFTREEAEQLVDELNAEYPEILHEAIPVPQSAPGITEEVHEEEHAPMAG